MSAAVPNEATTNTELEIEDHYFNVNQPFNVTIPVQLAGILSSIIISNENFGLSYSLFHNGQKITSESENRQASNQSRSEITTNYTITSGLVAWFSLSIPSPQLKDSGVYEMQLFWSIEVISSLNISACDDYFAIIKNDIELETPLIATATIHLLPESKSIIMSSAK